MRGHGKPQRGCLSVLRGVDEDGFGFERPVFTCSVLQEFAASLCGLGGHAFPKTVYNNFSYACAVVRANARSPLGFFELLLGLFLNKLVFLFVRTAADLVANPVDEATGECH